VIPEHVTVNQVVIKLVNVACIQPFHPRIANRLRQLMKGTYHLAVVALFHQRINTEQANEPLIEQQFIHEFMRLGASGFTPWHQYHPLEFQFRSTTH
jgi:hypothetical protein